MMKRMKNHQILNIAVINFYGRAMLQELSVNVFQWIDDTSQFNGDLIKIYNAAINENFFFFFFFFFFDVDAQYPEIHNYFSLLPERLKLEKVEKLVAKMHGEIEYVIQIRHLKQALHHGLVLSKVQSD